MSPDEQTKIHNAAEAASRCVISTGTTMNVLACMLSDDEPKLRMLQEAIEQLTPATEHLSELFVELNKENSGYAFDADDNRN